MHKIHHLHHLPPLFPNASISVWPISPFFLCLREGSFIAGLSSFCLPKQSWCLFQLDSVSKWHFRGFQGVSGEYPLFLFLREDGNEALVVPILLSSSASQLSLNIGKCFNNHTSKVWAVPCNVQRRRNQQSQQATKNTRIVYKVPRDSVETYCSRRSYFLSSALFTVFKVNQCYWKVIMELWQMNLIWDLPRKPFPQSLPGTCTQTHT